MTRVPKKRSYKEKRESVKFNLTCKSRVKKMYTQKKKKRRNDRRYRAGCWGKGTHDSGAGG